jgi:hypothetical protein
MPRSDSIEREWLEFARTILPADAHESQRVEMRRAFFAGAATALHLLAGLAEAPEDRAVESLESLHEECREFARRIARGQA